jgi:hypothetical protein
MHTYTDTLNTFKFHAAGTFTGIYEYFFTKTRLTLRIRDQLINQLYLFIYFKTGVLGLVKKSNNKIKPPRNH